MSDSIELKADLVICLQTQNLEEFKSVLSSTRLPLRSIKDNNNKNLFHELALTSMPVPMQLDFLTMIQISYFKHYEESALSYLKEDLNSRTTTEGISPLMYAVQLNRAVLVKKFIQLEADPYSKTKDGKTLVHIACQSGCFKILVYLKYELEMDLDALDNYNMSPLSLAVKEGKEAISSALISWDCNMHIKDKLGNSLLHIAALSENTSISKILVLRGIDRSTKNLDGLTAYDLTSKTNTKLLKIVQNPSCLSSFNPFRPPLSPTKNSYMLFTLYVFIFITRYALVLAFLLPHLSIELSIGSISFFIVNFFLFFAVHQKDPGYLSRSRGQNTVKLINESHPDNICTYCEILKTMTVFHCHHCDKCVEGYDHHCPWIRNCVGQKNYSTFFFFLTASWMDYLYTSVLGLLDFFQLLQKKRRFFDYKTYHKELGLFVTVICMICFAFTFPIWLAQIKGLMQKRKNWVKKSSKSEKKLKDLDLNESLRN